MSFLSIPFHFIATFLVAIAAAGGLWVGVLRPELGAPRGVARWSFGAGWTLLLVAEVVHGSFITGELELSVVMLRTAAYAILALSLVAGRGASLAPAVVPVTWAFGPGFFGLAAAGLALRSRLPAARRLALAFGFFGAAEVLVGASEAVLGFPRAAVEEPGVIWFAAHGLRLAGGIALGFWLGQLFRFSVRLRFVAAFVVLLLIVIVSISSAMTQVFASGVRMDALERARREGQLLQRRMDFYRDETLRVGRVVAENDSVQEWVARRDLENLRALSVGLLSPDGAAQALDFVAFLDAGGELLAFSSEPGPGEPPRLDEADVVSLAGSLVVQSVLRDEVQAGSVDTIGSKKIGLLGGFPIYPPGAQRSLAGVVVSGRVIVRDFLEELRGSRQEISVVTRSEVLATTLSEGAEELVRAGQGAEGPVFERGEVVSVQGLVGGIEFFSAFIPLQREGDRAVIGALVISQPLDVLAETQESLGRTLFLVALLATLVAVTAASVSGARITRPLRDLTAAAERISKGDLEARVQVSEADEVGALGDAFNQMTVSLQVANRGLVEAAEEELRLRSELETVLQSMTDGVISVDEAARIVTFNREAEHILRASAERARGRRIDEVLVLTDASGNPLDLPVYRLESGSATGSVPPGLRNGAPTPVAVTSAPIRDERGRVTGAVAVVRDLTREMEVERMKTEFLSNISHELRTPLTPIKGYADLLRRRQVPRVQQVKFLDSITASTKRLERVVEMLIDFSAMEAGRLVVKPVPLSLGGAVAALLEKWEDVTPKHRFERRGFGSLPPLNVDARLLPRAIDELIDNAVKFSPQGGRVVVSATARGSAEASVRITVRDEGIGVSRDQLERIFQGFVQVDASETRQFGGLGLGLAYVRRIVEAHGGALEAESVPGKGSKFSLVLPGSVISADGSPSESGAERRAGASAAKVAPERTGRSRKAAPGGAAGTGDGAGRKRSSRPARKPIPPEEP